MGNFIFNVFYFLFSCFLLWEAHNIKILTRSSQVIKSDFLPKTVLWIIVLLTLILCIVSWRQKNQVPDELKFKKNEISGIGIVVLTIGSYIFIVPYLGYIISTVIFLSIFMIVMGIKKKKYSFITSVAYTFSSVYLFGNVLSIQLPRGIGVFRTLSTFFY